MLPPSVSALSFSIVSLYCLSNFEYDNTLVVPTFYFQSVMVTQRVPGSPPTGESCEEVRLVLHDALASTAAQKGELRKQTEPVHLSFTVPTDRGATLIGLYEVGRDAIMWLLIVQPALTAA